MKDWNNSLPQNALVNQGKDILPRGLFYKQIVHDSAGRFSETFSVSSSSIKNSIFVWVQKFREHGTVQNLNSKGLRDTYCSRRVSARPERNIDAVRDSVGRSPKNSLRRRSQELGISPESLRRILKSDLNLYPYQIQIKQKLTQADMEKRVTMCRWFCDTIEDNPDFLNHVWFSDEAHFLLSGHVNSKNNFYCGTLHRRMSCRGRYTQQSAQHG